MKVKYAISSSKQYNGIMDCIKKNYKRKGFWSFYRGYSTSMAGIVPYAGVDLATYEVIVHRWDAISYAYSNNRTLWVYEERTLSKHEICNKMWRWKLQTDN